MLTSFKKGVRVESLEIKKALFYASYSQNSQKAREEMAKSIFVTSVDDSIQHFRYVSQYKLQERTQELLTREYLSYKEAYEKTVINLTGLTPKEYEEQIEKIYLIRKDSHKDPRIILENFNFEDAELNLALLGKANETYAPQIMLQNFLKYLKDVSFCNYMTEAKTDLLFEIDESKLIEMLEYKQSEELYDDKALFLSYVSNNISYVSTHSVDERVLLMSANAIGFDETQREIFLGICKNITLNEERVDFAFAMLQSYYTFLRALAKYRLKYLPSKVLYFGKYAKDFVNLYENSFFKQEEYYNDERKYGVALWAEISTQGRDAVEKLGVTKAELKVTCAKNYFDGHKEIIGTLSFEYVICAYKKGSNQELYLSSEKSIEQALSSEAYVTLCERFYPLYGVDKREGFKTLIDRLITDEEERGAILKLKEINLSSHYSDKTIASLIRGVYDLIGYSTPPSFPLCSCVVSGDIIINDEIFPAIKTPLFTLIKANYLKERMQKMQQELTEKSFLYSDFFSEYKANAHHYYAKMSFDPLRPILIY